MISCKEDVKKKKKIFRDNVKLRSKGGLIREDKPTDTEKLVLQG